MNGAVHMVHGCGARVDVTCRKLTFASGVLSVTVIAGGVVSSPIAINREFGGAQCVVASSVCGWLNSSVPRPGSMARASARLTAAAAREQ